MCGIAGAMRFGDEPITPDQVKVLLVKLQSRGADATGLAIHNEGEDQLKVLKSDDPAWNFVTMKRYQNFVEEHLLPTTRSVILHTRAATCGTPRRNENNHPLYSNLAAVVHNGIINNHTELYREMGLEAGAETDSDILRAIVDKHGLTKQAIKKLQRVRGSVAAAILHPGYPGKMILLRSGSPLVMCRTQGELFLFASEKDALHQALRQWENWKGFHLQANRTNVVFNTMMGDTAYLIGPEGIEYRDEFKSCHYYNGPTYRIWDNYPDRQEKWDKMKLEDRPRYVLCPNPECKDAQGHPLLVKIKSEHKHLPLWELTHAKCKTALGTKPETEALVLVN